MGGTDTKTMLRTILIATLGMSHALLPGAANAQADALDHLRRAREAYSAERYEAALAQADSAIALESDLPGAHKLRGDIKQRQGNMHGALLDYTRAQKLEPKDARVHISMSAIHITEGRLKDAIREAGKAVKLAPDDPDGWYNRACANYLGQNNEAALRDLERAIRIKPENADALFLRGVVKGEMYKEADGLEDIDAAVALDPSIVGGRMSAAVLLFEMKRYEEAIARLNAIIEDKGEELIEAIYYRADSHYNLGDKESACADWRQAAELGDEDAVFIVRNYCLTDEAKIPKKPVKQRKTVIQF